MSHQVCKACSRQFWWERTKGQDEAPEVCGRLECRASASWTIQEWEGQARMAESRRRVGAVLNGLDREALRRVNGGING